jgi:hypothetical protein
LTDMEAPISQSGESDFGLTRAEIISITKDKKDKEKAKQRKIVKLSKT